MGYSRYTNAYVPANTGNYSKGRAGNTITRITPHHVAGNLSADRTAQLFQAAGRGASANYCIDGTGRVVCSVQEEDRAWTSSSGTNDNRAVTFELSNSGGSPDWPINDACMNKFIEVAIDICQRYGIKKLVKGETLTWHQMFASTSCPGPYALGKMSEIEQRINTGLGAVVPESPKPVEPGKDTYTVVRGDTLGAIAKRFGTTVSAIASLNNIPDPNRIIVGQVLRIPAGAVTPAPSQPAVNLTAVARDVIAGKYGNGVARTQALTNAGYDAGAVQAEVNRILLGQSNPPQVQTPVKSVTDIAREVIAGKWGNGADRVSRLTKAGYNASAVQSEVNRLLR